MRNDPQQRLTKIKKNSVTDDNETKTGWAPNLA